MFQEIDYLFHFSEKPADVSKDRLFISFPKNLLMFQERDYLFHFSEKPADISRDTLYYFTSRKPADVSERLAVLFQNRS